MTARYASVLAIILSGFLVGGVAQAADKAETKVNVERGRYLIQTCLGCHGIEGYTNVYPTYKVPKLGGQNAQYIINALKAYRTGKRDYPTMQAQARSLTMEEIRIIANYIASLEPPR